VESAIGVGDTATAVGEPKRFIGHVTFHSGRLIAAEAAEKVSGYASALVDELLE
jgi:hypothetical protein